MLSRIADTIQVRGVVMLTRDEWTRMATPKVRSEFLDAKLANHLDSLRRTLEETIATRGWGR